MVSKLLLAVQETALRNQHEACIMELVEKYHEISKGLGFNKSPSDFGAFPTDPYSHSPKGQGARQPGMTGVVKEEIIARQAEVGLVIENGRLTFNSFFIDPKELQLRSEDLKGDARTPLYHPLVHQLLRRFIKGQPAAVVQELGPEAEVEQVAGGMLAATHVQVDLVPVLDGLR